MYDNAQNESINTSQYSDPLAGNSMDKQEKIWKNNSMPYENNGNIGDLLILNHPQLNSAHDIC